MRASDIGIVSPGRRQRGHQRRRRGHHRPDPATPASPTTPRARPGFFRDSSRCGALQPVHRPRRGRRGAPRATPGRPADYLPFGSADALPGGQPATSIAARFSAGHTTTWTYRDGGYVNDDGFAADDDQFPADTVLVLRVKVGDAGYRDPAGNPVPETKLEGTGEAMLFHGGRLVRGTWSKDALDAPLAPAHAGRRRSPYPRVTPGSSWSPPPAATSPSTDGSAVGLVVRVVLAGGTAARLAGISTPASVSAWKPAMMKLIATSTRSAAATLGSSAPATDSPADDIAPKKIRAKVCTMSSSSSHDPATQHRAHDVDDVGVGRALLLLAEALVAEHRRAVLHDDPAVARLLDDLEEDAQARARLVPRVPGALQRLLDGARGVVLDPLEDGLEERLLAREVVVERALGDLGAGDDRVERGVGVAVLGEELLGDVDQRALGRGRVGRAPAHRRARPGTPGTLGTSLETDDLGTRPPYDLAHTAVVVAATARAVRRWRVIDVKLARTVV